MLTLVQYKAQLDAASAAVFLQDYLDRTGRGAGVVFEPPGE